MHGLEWIGFLIVKVISLQSTNVGRVQVFSLSLNTVAFLCVLVLSLGVIYIYIMYVLVLSLIVSHFCSQFSKYLFSFVCAF
jgi:hypothetical protein